MTKILATTALASLLMVGTVHAQDAQQPAATPAPATEPAAVETVAAPTERFIQMQAQDDWLASRMIGSTIYGSGDETLGDINDIVIASNGQIKAVVIGVGGFLGIGEKNVALAPTSFQTIAGTDASALKLRLSMTKEQLTQAQAFETTRDKELAARRATTGTSNPMSPRPGSSNTPPTTNR